MNQAGSSGSASQDVVVQQAKMQEFQLAGRTFNVRSIGTEEEPWFVAADIGKVLGIEKMSHHLGNYKEGTEKGVEDLVTPGGVQKMIVLSEMATYKFLMRSQKPQAEPFQDWLAGIVKKLRLEGRYDHTGVARFGESQWRQILTTYAEDFHPKRTNVALKDRWRTITKNVVPPPAYVSNTVPQHVSTA